MAAYAALPCAAPATPLVVSSNFSIAGAACTAMCAICRRTDEFGAFLQNISVI
jgi:hypothetical protein